MRWLNITDENGQIVKDRLPKYRCKIVFRYTNGGFDDGNYGTIRLMANDNDVRFLASMEVTHILILTDPNAPQPEDGLVELLKEIQAENKAALSGEQSSGDHYSIIEAFVEKTESALSAWEGGKA